MIRDLLIKSPIALKSTLESLHRRKSKGKGQNVSSILC